MHIFSSCVGRTPRVVNKLSFFFSFFIIIFLGSREDLDVIMGDISERLVSERKRKSRQRGNLFSFILFIYFLQVHNNLDNG